MKGKGLILLLFLAAAGAVVWYSLKGRGQGASPAASSGQATAEAPGRVGGPAVEVTFVYGTEKREWLEDAAAAFARDNADVKVTLVGKGSLEAVEAILEGKLQPTAFSPADSLALTLLAADWETKHHTRLLGEGDDAPQPLVITPLVLAIWQDRAEVLQRSGGGEVTWKAIAKAVGSNRGWPAVGGKAEWGFVKLGHTDPTRSNSGLQALLLMTYEYWNRTSGLTVGDLLDPRYQAFVAGLERGVTKFEPSTGTFMVDMVRFGPSRYDIAVVYESSVIGQIENAQGRWGDLKVYYPRPTLWSDHPAAVLQAPWVTPAQKAAARRFLAFLRSRPTQERALAFGFRPADPAVPVRTADAQNPFTRLAPHGLRVDLPPAASVPDPAVTRNLLTMWTRVVSAR